MAPLPSFPFHKMEACGNDFVVVYGSALPHTAGSHWAPLLCDRRFGIGADGVLVVRPAAYRPRPGTDEPAASMTVWNADGSVAEMCGNGLRCVVRRLVEDGRWPGDEGFVTTAVGTSRVRLVEDEVRVEIGKPRVDLSGGKPRSFAVAWGGVAGAAEGLIVDMGNPHFVVFADDQEAPLPDLLRWAPDVETADPFPDRTNVEWVVQEGPSLLRMRVWERGVGETLACGSGACAAVAAARLTGRCDTDEVAVKVPGGPLTVSWSGRPEDPVELQGPARTVFSGTWKGKA